MPDDLVLKTRLALLRSNLEQVARIFEASRREVEISRLGEYLLGGRLKTHTVNIYEELHNARGALDAARQLSDPDAVSQRIRKATECIGNAQDDLRQVQTRLGKCEEDLAKIFDRRVELRGRTVVSDGMALKARDQIEEMAKLEAGILKGKGPKRAKNLAKAWSFTKEALDPSEPLFVEYLDVLRGVALRETGLDEGICEMADSLLREVVGSVNWKSLTIPARREAMAMTVARIIRLGFPEWTIWAVPLAAHEFGHIVADHEKAKDIFKRHAGRGKLLRSNMENCFADAFATYTMGPAYACAALLLRLNPFPPRRREGPFADSARAYVILEMLARADNRSEGLASSFRDIRERLEREWSAAVGQAGAHKLSDQERAKLREWVDDFGDFLRSAVTGGYSADSWGNAQALAVELLKGDGPPPVRVLREVPNAAWICRLDHPEKTVEIRVAAESLWKSSLEKEKVTGTSKGPPSRLYRTRKGPL